MLSQRPSRRMVLASAFAPYLASAQSNRKPNILIVLADDQGWGDLSVHGNRNLSTPNIDSLARDGAMFERFFSCPVCAPTRAEFLTGRYHARGGVRGVSTGAERLNLDETTIAQTFQKAGYKTAAFGKWHNGSQHPYHPNARGFEEYYGFTSGHWGQYFSPELDHNGKLVRGKGFITDDLTNHAMAFIEQNRSRPFFCYVPFNTPHSPMQVPDGFYDRFAGKELPMRHADTASEDLQFTRAAMAMCENIDYNVGRLLKKLDELKLSDNTIVIYFSDNGPNSWRWNGGMKGRKGSVDEGGLRVPFLIRYPPKIQKGLKVTPIAAAIDMLPTLTDFAGIPITSTKPLDGISFKPLLTGEKKTLPDRMIFSMMRNRISVRTQQYRLDQTGKLYDMIADPGQLKDVAAERPQVASKLKDAVAKFGKEVILGEDDRPFTVGYSATTLLPARDGVNHGDVKRSANAPNCSYFTNWKKKTDSITWDIEVGQAGNYDAAIYYTCPNGDQGSRIELSFLNAKVEGRVAEAHDPPLEGKKEDRVDRGAESYVKAFKPLALGVIQLPKARGTITLRATDIPGKSVADVRYLVLSRKA